MKAKILIVDDIAVNRMKIKLSLKDENYEFIEASNGQESIDMAIKENPEIILMDAMMPIMDGFEATKKIRKIESVQRIPILMITSLDSTEDKIKALDSGVNDFINKAFDKLELKARCKAYIETANLNKNYILASKNIVSGYPNKSKLLKDIEKSKNNQDIFLIYMDNYTLHENFYGNKVSEYLDQIFIDNVSLFTEHIHYTLYHISNGKYALLSNQQTLFNESSAKIFCQELIDHTKQTKYEFTGFHFDINITVSYANSSQELYENANTLLSYALSEKKEYITDMQTLMQIKDTIKKNIDVLNMIKTSLNENRILPFYQPIYNIQNKEIKRYEALVRMYDDNQGIVYPQPYFLDVAKKGKLYPNITKLIVEKVINTIRFEDCEVSINLSSLDIENDTMRKFLLQTLHDNKDIAHKLIFELLEDKDTNSYQIVKNFIEVSKSYGVKIAIDDFGSGFSNFIRIIEFQPDIIKIDGSLIKDIATSKASRQTVEAIKIFSDKIHAKTVAEYVENKEIFEIINEIGIDYAQGYYIGKAEKNLRTIPEYLQESVLEPL